MDTSIKHLLEKAEQAAQYLEDQLEAGATFKNLDYPGYLKPHPRPVNCRTVVAEMRAAIPRQEG